MKFEEFVERVYQELEDNCISYLINKSDNLKEELKGTLSSPYETLGIERLEVDSPEVRIFAQTYRKGFVHGVLRTKDYGFK